MAMSSTSPLCLLAITSLATAATPTPWRILPLGDSITLGCGFTASPPGWYAVCDKSSGSYRAALWAALSAANASTVFVGRSSSGPDWLPVEQRNHEGHGGWTVPMLRGIVNETLKAATPDAILLLAGTNDVGQGHPLETIVANMTSLLSDLRSGAPTAKIFVGTVINMVNSGNPQWSAAIDAFNAVLPTLVANVGGVLVDLHNKTGLCPPNEGATQRLCAECNAPGAPLCPPKGYDRVHPTAAGYSVMAGVWAGAVLPYIPQH